MSTRTFHIRMDVLPSRGLLVPSDGVRGVLELANNFEKNHLVHSWVREQLESLDIMFLDYSKLDVEPLLSLGRMAVPVVVANNHKKVDIWFTLYTKPEA